MLRSLSRELQAESERGKGYESEEKVCMRYMKRGEKRLYSEKQESAG